MKSRPILFSGPMVRALLDGTKTQTRRVVNPKHLAYMDVHQGLREPTNVEVCPYGQPGDQLWVRETFCPIYPQDPAYNGGHPIEHDYAATYTHGFRLGDLLGIKKVWKPSIHMPRAASRITLEITGVRVERLKDISEADSIAEGCEPNYLPNRAYQDKPYKSGYVSLWQGINGHGSWRLNPWVWVIEFKRVVPV